MIANKQTRGYISQVASSLRLFLKKIRKISFLQEQIAEYTVAEIQFQSVNYTLVARVSENFKENKTVGKLCLCGVQGKSSIYQVLKSMKRLESHSTQQNIFQHYYTSYCHYLLKMGRMNEKQAVFKQLTLSDFKKRSSTALKAHPQV